MIARRLHGFIKQHREGVRRNFSGKTVPLFYTDLTQSTEFVELPRRLQRSERKPLVTSINELKRRARLERKSRQEVREIALRPPENGLLVKRLVPVAHEVYRARQKLFSCASRVLENILVHVCRVCQEVHIGAVPHFIRTCDFAGSLPTKEHSWVRGGIEHVLPLIESFHLYDRLGRAVSHEERLLVDRIPAIVELCIQAGLDIPEYPTKRRTIPVYNVAGKIIDFERKFPRDYSNGKDIQTHGFWEKRNSHKCTESHTLSHDDSLQDIATRGMEAWEKVQSGVSKLMTKYTAQTCGFCPEVQVGTKGHRARICQAYKHQMRDGQHAWQEATMDDLMPPVYVWHVPDPQNGKPLVDELRRYYGKLPAVVELFVQAGAGINKAYGGVMRGDVVVPGLDEEKLVV
ncbi:APO protein 3, mitochondrial-like [Canna indica]|uniref:APO protein 3, mitochondrial-like n=1 Tax=Canna indica TaxID=4628 RepID=A0AAQ3KS36_9LILI|nr:APO protein 3, mitochondrial-like [Canna indica]